MTWKTCKIHGDDKPGVWGCPECLRELREENKRLKDALFFWLPNIPAIENECTDRMANDAALLIGHEGRIDDSAEQRGWVALTPNTGIQRAREACPLE